jgi:hypothetical protein
MSAMKRAFLTFVVFMACVGTASAATTKAAYIRTADQMCKRVDAQLVPLQSKLRQVKQSEALTLLGKIAKLELASYKRLKKLPRPTADVSALNKVWAARGLAVVESQNTVVALGDFKPDAAAKDERVQIAAEASYKKLARAFGFRVCGH